MFFELPIRTQRCSDDDHPFYVSTRYDLPLVADLIASTTGHGQASRIDTPPIYFDGVRRVGRLHYGWARLS